jgi:hypothetical protein
MVNMAAAQTQVQQDIKAQFLGMIEKKLGKPLNQAVQTQTVPLTVEGMEQEGATDPDDYIRSIQQDLLDGILKQTISSTNFMPMKLDPNVYDQSTLFMTSPALTFLEGRNRRAPADTTKINFIELIEGFSAEWINETEGTLGDGTAQTQLGLATMCVQALPISLSDLLGSGQSAQSRAQLMQYAQEALREDFDNTIINGTTGTQGSPTNKFSGLMTIAQAQGYSEDASGNPLLLKNVRNLEAQLTQQRKGWADFILTNVDVHNQLVEDMTATVKNVNTVNITANTPVTAFQSSRGPLPIITDPYVPYTVPGANTNSGVFGMFNSNRIFISDFVHNSWVEKGKTKPVATDGWLVQVSVMYNAEPLKTAIRYDLPSAEA